MLLRGGLETAHDPRKRAGSLEVGLIDLGNTFHGAPGLSVAGYDLCTYVQRKRKRGVEEGGGGGCYLLASPSSRGSIRVQNPALRSPP